jgi:hypothetical protein
MTFLAGLRHDRIDAPMLIDGAIDGASFRAWVEQRLAPRFGRARSWSTTRRAQGAGDPRRHPTRPARISSSSRPTAWT